MSAKRQAAEAKAKASGGKLSTYNVLTKLHYDGEDYAPGSTVEMDSFTAQPLIDCKCVALLADA